MKTSVCKKAPSFVMALLALAATFAIAPAARADSYSFAFSGNGISTSGIITATATTYPGAYQITGISGTFSDTNAGVSGAITGLEFAPPPDRTPGSTFFPAPAFTDSGFSYDNLFYPDGNSPAVCIDAQQFFGGLFDVYGTVFDVAGGYTVDIWSQGALGGYMVGDSFAGVKLTAGVPVNGGASPVPEPGSLVLIGTGLFGLAGTLRRRIKGPKVFNA